VNLVKLISVKKKIYQRNLPMSETIIIATIQAASVIFAAVISGLAIILSARAILKKKVLRRKLMAAYQDLAFMYEVEAVHIGMEIGRGETDNKIKVRNIVRSEKGFTLSGKSKTEIQRELAALSTIDS
jgi:hypothetical protein